MPGGRRLTPAQGIVSDTPVVKPQVGAVFPGTRRIDYAAGRGMGTQRILSELSPYFFTET